MEIGFLIHSSQQHTIEYKAVVCVCVYLYVHTVSNTTILQLVAIYNIHVSALYVLSKELIDYTVCVVILEGGRELVLHHKSWDW